MKNQSRFNRRQALGAGAAALTAGVFASQPSVTRAQDETTRRVQHGNIRQSVMGWCFNPMDAVELAKHSRDIGLVGIEGIDRKHYPAVRELGLEISLVGSHGFARGPVNRDNHEHCIEKLREAIDVAVAVASPSVITFTGMREEGITDKQAERNCIECWKRVIEYAEEKEITLCMEHLNSRDDTHPMKGHPGYFGDDVDHCVEMIKQVDSPYFKLLFDCYHVQVMNGDVIRRIQQYHSLIGHYHTAGNPGRGELDETQEMYYPPIMKAILETGYTGFVAQEFIPTWDDPVAALRHAAVLCDVEG